METKEFPKGAQFAPYLCSFMNKYSISADELALAIEMSKYTIYRFKEGRSYPTDVAYAEFCILFTIVAGKDFNAYKKISRKDKNDLVAKFLASGSSICTIGGMIALISEAGVVAGLSAAGVTSGLAAIGAIVGGGMVTGIACVAAAPLIVGGIIYFVFKPKQKKPNFFLAHRDDLDPKFEYKGEADSSDDDD